MYGQNNNPYGNQNYFGALTPPLQPSGMVYQVQNSMEVNAIPVAAGIVAAINMQENLLYLKSANNGTATYKLTPYVEPVKTNDSNNNLEQRLSSMEQQLSSLIAALNKNDTRAAKEQSPQQPIPWDA